MIYTSNIRQQYWAVEPAYYRLDWTDAHKCFAVRWNSCVNWTAAHAWLRQRT